MYLFASSGLLISLIFAFMMQMLWGAVNSLQLIVLTVLFNVLMPVNALEVLTQIMMLVNLDVIDTRFLLDTVITLKDLPGFNIRFQEVGYDTSSFLIELGPLLFIVLGSLTYLLAKALLKRATRCCGDNWFSKRVRAKVYFTAAVIRFFLESCIELGLIAMICVSTVSSLQNLITRFPVDDKRELFKHRRKHFDRTGIPYSVMLGTCSA